MPELSPFAEDALLACALFCLFPNAGRGEARLPAINFDTLFAYAPWLISLWVF